MELTIDLIKQVVKEAIIEAEAEVTLRKKESKRKDKDLISKNEAYRLRTRAIVEELIDRGLLKSISSGRASNSTQWISKKRLFELDSVIL